MKYALFAWVLVGLAVGCGPTVIAPNETGVGAGGGAISSSPTATNSGTGGSGGVVIGPPEPACDDPSVFLDVAGDVSVSFDPECVLSGQINHGTSPGLERLEIIGCVIVHDRRLRLSAHEPAWPATSNHAQVELLHPAGSYSEAPTESGVLDVHTFGSVGGVIEGSFNAALGATDPATVPWSIDVVGKFRVCRGPDVYVD